jgi:alkyl sulfatase BDS1-like metallo-beta-lactamase superfamily hydrolase
VIVVDPLISTECAAAAFNLYQSHRGKRTVKALIYTHSHIDHFGGAAGVINADGTNVLGERIPIIAPEGFEEHAQAENVLLGTAMRRRAAYMYGSFLRPGPEGNIGVGLGLPPSRGTTSWVKPNVIVGRTGEEMDVDGVRVVFQMVNGTEAPSEFNLFLPGLGSVLVAECAVMGMHNVITLRGAEVRDARAWGRGLDETLVMYEEMSGRDDWGKDLKGKDGKEEDVLFFSHAWPVWSRGNILTHLAQARDVYSFLHDQTVRYMNLGLTGAEIAERITLPAELQKAWHAQGFYGSVSHNVKGIYQKYMTWFDGRAESLWAHEPTEEAKRWVDCLGGIENVVSKAEEYSKKGDLRFAATLLGHAYKVDSTNQMVGNLLGDIYEALGRGSECATWRNWYLMSALEVRDGGETLRRMMMGGKQRDGSGMAVFGPGLGVEQWLDGLSVLVDGMKAGKESMKIDLEVAGAVEGVGEEENGRWILILSNGVLTTRKVTGTGRTDATLTLRVSKIQLLGMLYGKVRVEDLRAGDQVRGEGRSWERLMELCGILSENLQSQL